MRDGFCPVDQTPNMAPTKLDYDYDYGQVRPLHAMLEPYKRRAWEYGGDKAAIRILCLEVSYLGLDKDLVGKRKYQAIEKQLCRVFSGDSRVRGVRVSHINFPPGPKDNGHAHIHVVEDVPRWAVRYNTN